MKKKTLPFCQMACRSIAAALFCMVLFTETSFGQRNIKISDIEVIRKQYQTCLDKGDFMLGCSQNYYKGMDSCLNVVYKQLRYKLDEPAKAKLKKEQLTWLKKRDVQFRRIEKMNKEEGQDGQMVRQDEKTEFVKERVNELIQRLDQ